MRSISNLNRRYPRGEKVEHIGADETIKGGVWQGEFHGAIGLQNLNAGSERLRLSGGSEPWNDQNSYHCIMEPSLLSGPVYIWLSGAVFALLHSGLASLHVKSFFHARGLSPRTYRLAYVVFSIFATAGWLFYIHQLADRPLYGVDPPWRYLLHLVQILGLWIFLQSLRPIDTRAFLGLRPFRHDVEDFVEKGIYRHVRHPMYSGIMLIMFAMPGQSINSLALYAFVAAYFIVGSRFEESRLLKAHPEYADYRKRVPPFIPRLPRRRKHRDQT